RAPRAGSRRAAGLGRRPPRGDANVRAAVMGAGMWGTTFAQVLCDAGTPVTLWGRRPDLVAAINSRHENPDYLPGITLPAELTASADAARVVLAVPAQTLRHHLGAWRHLLPPGAAFASLMKGIELGTHDRMSEVIA